MEGPDIQTPSFSTARIVFRNSQSAPLEMTDQLRVPLPFDCAQGRLLSRLFFGETGRGFLTLSNQLGRSKSPPSRPERGKDGAPGLAGDVEERPFMAALFIKKIRPLGPGRTPNAQINMAWASAHAMSAATGLYCCWASTICGKGLPLLSFVRVSSV